MPAVQQIERGRKAGDASADDQDVAAIRGQGSLALPAWLST
jgi:hypothetical protein